MSGLSFFIRKLLLSFPLLHRFQFFFLSFLYWHSSHSVVESSSWGGPWSIFHSFPYIERMIPMYILVLSILVDLFPLLLVLNDFSSPAFLFICLFDVFLLLPSLFFGLLSPSLERNRDEERETGTKLILSRVRCRLCGLLSLLLVHSFSRTSLKSWMKFQVLWRRSPLSYTLSSLSLDADSLFVHRDTNISLSLTSSTN